MSNKARKPDPTGVGPWARPPGVTADLLERRVRRGELHSAAVELLRVVGDVEWDKLDAQALDDVERACQQIATRVRVAQSTAVGWRYYHGWDRNAPWVEREEYGTWSIISDGRPVDHIYRLRRNADDVDKIERPIYVSEPYELGLEGMHHLLDLDNAGWSVTVRASGARHFPGHTLAISLCRKDASL